MTTIAGTAAIYILSLDVFIPVYFQSGTSPFIRKKFNFIIATIYTFIRDGSFNVLQCVIIVCT